MKVIMFPSECYHVMVAVIVIELDEDFSSAGHNMSHIETSGALIKKILEGHLETKRSN